MTLENDDPRLTAHALGALSPEERAEVEALLTGDTRAKAEVAALREVAARLERGLSAVGGPALSAEQRARIFATAAPNGAARSGHPNPEALVAVERVPPSSAEAKADDPSRRENAVRPGSASGRRSRRAWLLLAALVPSIGALVMMLRGPSDVGELTTMAVAPASVTGESKTSERMVLTVPPAEAFRVRELAPGTMRAEPQPSAALYAAPRATGEVAMPHRSARAPAARSELARSRSQPIASQRAASPPDRGDFDFAVGPPPSSDRERYDAVDDNPFVRVATDPRSTFSIDVDTASYALVRRFLQAGQLPPKGAIRIEELINYFSYEYPEPSPSAPISVVADVAKAPWAPSHRLVRIGMKARHVSKGARPAANLVFLIDVSGSMASDDKLPLVKYGLQRLAGSLEARDRVSMVVYAGASGVVLDAAPGNREQEIFNALERLEAGGSTNGGEGIELAYALARKQFVQGGVNRVILATDGDFNVGVTNENDLVDLIQRQARSGVFLSVLGFGTGNYQDSTLEKLADKGNGNYAYIDDAREARKVLVEQATGTLITVAKDVKLQLEFNPREVEAYRLIGYENRVLQHQDFNDDTKDAGEIGADHSVTALYEVIPAGRPVPGEGVDALRYQASEGLSTTGTAPSPKALGGELLHVKLRYQPPEGGASRLLTLPVQSTTRALEGEFRFAAAVAELGMLLRASPWRGDASYDGVLELARSALGHGRDREAREEFLALVKKANELAKRDPASPLRDPLRDELP